jgi:PAS domain S-box-containing protein
MLHDQSWYGTGYGRWADLMLAGEAVHGPVRTFPESEQPELELQDILSTIAVPIYVAGTWWGQIGFDDCETEREWPPAERDALRAAAGVLGAIIHREQAESDLAALAADLRVAEEQYRLLVENSPLVTYQESATQRDPLVVHYLGPQVEDLLGYPQSKWADPNFWKSTLHPDDREATLAEEARTIDTGDPFIVDYRAIAADGSVKWIHDESVMIEDAEGNPLIWQGFMQDVTERKLAEEQLLQIREQYRDVLERSPAVPYQALVDDDGNVNALYLGPQIEEWLGYAITAWNDPGFWNSITHPDDLPAMVEADRKSNETREPFSLDYRLVKKDGEIVWVHDEAVMVDDPGKQGPVWHGLVTDITERKRADDQLQHALEIEHQSVERLSELDDMKNTFLQAVSHDLRTPLTAILGLALTLERQPNAGPAEVEDISGRIARNARKLDKLVNDMLDLDRLTRGIVEMTRYPVDLARLVQSVVDSAENVDRVVHKDLQPVFVEVDAAKVERIVENLINNAARHTPKTAQIWVSVRPFEGGGLLAVEDDGGGVPESEVESIFDEFQRGSESATHSPGMGVGLSLVRRFAEMHGGKAWVEGRENGTGASFRVFLPGGGESGPASAAG